MNLRLPTQSEIDELLAFLPKLYDRDFQAVKAQDENLKMEDGVIEMSSPEYHPDVVKFFQIASEEQWNDPDYVPTRATAMLQRPEAVMTASLSEVRSLLTLCVRGERFCDGYWESVISEGQVRSVLLRLQELRSALVK